jgi:hypothetical protein
MSTRFAVHRRVHEALRLLAMPVKANVVARGVDSRFLLTIGFHKVVIIVVNGLRWSWGSGD